MTKRQSEVQAQRNARYRDEAQVRDWANADWLASHPGASIADIARAWGVSRARAYALLARAKKEKA